MEDDPTVVKKMRGENDWGLVRECLLMEERND